MEGENHLTRVVLWHPTPTEKSNLNHYSTTLKTAPVCLGSSRPHRDFTTCVIRLSKCQQHCWKHLCERTALGSTAFPLHAQNYLLVQKHSGLITEKKEYFSTAISLHLRIKLVNCWSVLPECLIFEIALWAADLTFILKRNQINLDLELGQNSQHFLKWPPTHPDSFIWIHVKQCSQHWCSGNSSINQIWKTPNTNYTLQHQILNLDVTEFSLGEVHCLQHSGGRASVLSLKPAWCA